MKEFQRKVKSRKRQGLKSWNRLRNNPTTKIHKNNSPSEKMIENLPREEPIKEGLETQINSCMISELVLYDILHCLFHGPSSFLDLTIKWDKKMKLAAYQE